MQTAKPRHELVFGDDPERGGFRLLSGGEGLSPDRLRSLEALAALRPGSAIRGPERRMGPLGKFYFEIRYEPLVGARVGSITANVRIFSELDPVDLVGGADSAVRGLRHLAAGPSSEVSVFIEALLLAVEGATGMVQVPLGLDEALASMIGALPPGMRDGMALATSDALGKGIDKSVLVEPHPGSANLRLTGNIAQPRTTRLGRTLTVLIERGPEELLQVYERLGGLRIPKDELALVVCAEAVLAGLDVGDLVRAGDMHLLAGVGIDNLWRRKLMEALYKGGERHARVSEGQAGVLTLLRDLAELMDRDMLDRGFVLQALEDLTHDAGAWIAADAGLGLTLEFAKPFEKGPLAADVRKLLPLLASQNPSLETASPDELYQYLRGARKLGLELPEMAERLLDVVWAGGNPLVNSRFRREAHRHLPESYRVKLERFLGPLDLETFMKILKKSKKRYARNPLEWRRDVNDVLKKTTSAGGTVHLEKMCSMVRPKWFKADGGETLYRVGELAQCGDRKQAKAILNTTLSELLSRRGGGKGAVSLVAGALRGVDNNGQLDRAKLGDLHSVLRGYVEPRQFGGQYSRVAVIQTVGLAVFLVGLLSVSGWMLFGALQDNWILGGGAVSEDPVEPSPADHLPTNGEMPAGGSIEQSAHRERGQNEVRPSGVATGEVLEDSEALGAGGPMDETGAPKEPGFEGSEGPGSEVRPGEGSQGEVR